VDTQFQADPQQLKQVMINLIQNAAESIGQNGVITLGARDGDYRFKGQNQKVVIIEITDTGPGIPATVQEHLFDPFFSTKDGGTGWVCPFPPA
jgi:signal transduction histidine kinase